MRTRYVRKSTLAIGKNKPISVDERLQRRISQIERALQSRKVNLDKLEEHPIYGLIYELAHIETRMITYRTPNV